MQPANVAEERAALSSTLTEVLANLAFMVCEADDPNPPRPTREGFAAEIGYSGPACGRLRIWAPREIAQQLAANLLGIEPQDSQSRDSARDAVAEFANVVCGQWVTAAYGAEAVFNLTVPSVTAAAVGTWQACEPRRLRVDGFDLLFSHERGDA